MMITKSNLDLIQGYKAGLKLVMVMVTVAMMMMMTMMLKMVVMIAEKQSGFKGILLQPASIHQPPRHPIYFRPPMDLYQADAGADFNLFFTHLSK